MLTKRELTDLVIENLSGGMQPDYSKYHPVVVAKYVDVALNSIIAQDVQKALNEGDNLIDCGWVKVFERVRLRIDTVRDMVYIKFPSSIILLKGNKGIRQIMWPQTGEGPPFRIQDFTSMHVISNLECSQTELGEHIVYIEGDRVYMPSVPKQFVINKASVIVKAVCTTAGYTEDEQLPFPEERVAEVFGMIQQLMMMMKQTRAKVTNDSNPNTA